MQVSTHMMVGAMFLGCMVSSTPYPTGCYPPPVDLAVVPTEVRPLPEAWMKIRIDTGHIKVDVDTSRLALTSADPSNLFRSQPIPLHQGTIGEADLNMSLITPLYDLLHTHIKTVRQFSACFVRPDLDTSMVVFEIAPDVPYGTVARAVYTAGQAQFSTFVFAVEGPNGAVGALHVDAPKIIAGVRKANRPEPQALCIQPSTTVGREGVQMRAHERPWDGALIAKAYRPDKTRIAAELFQGDTPSRLSELLGGSGGLGGAPVVDNSMSNGTLNPSASVAVSDKSAVHRPSPEPPGGRVEDTCAWLSTHRTEELPLDALRQHMERLKGLGELCTVHVVSGHPEVPWGSVASAMAVGADVVGGATMLAFGLDDDGLPCERPWWPSQ
ncbi:MAG: hypothetical protein AAFX99_08535 [Myxococcota bacterium]